MSSFEWMELQTLTAEIATARSRLTAARSTKDQGRVRALEDEIRAAEGRRDRLLAHISTNLASDAEASAKAQATGATYPPAAAPIDEPAPEEAGGKKRSAKQVAAEAAAAEAEIPPPAVVEPAAAEIPDEAPPEAPKEIIVATIAAPPAPAPKADSVEGGSMAWDQVTPGDLDRAKHELGLRRAEILARHAAELQELEADQAQLQVLEEAIDAFSKKFAKSAVVKLDAERGLRQQGGN